LLDGVALQPEDGLVLMPTDITATLSAHGLSVETMTGLAEALDAPLECMMEQMKRPPR